MTENKYDISRNRGSGMSTASENKSSSNDDSSHDTLMVVGTTMLGIIPFLLPRRNDNSVNPQYALSPVTNVGTTISNNIFTSNAQGTGQWDINNNSSGMLDWDIEIQDRSPYIWDIVSIIIPACVCKSILCPGLMNFGYFNNYPASRRDQVLDRFASQIIWHVNGHRDVRFKGRLFNGQTQLTLDMQYHKTIGVKLNDLGFAASERARNGSFVAYKRDTHTALGALAREGSLFRFLMIASSVSTDVDQDLLQTLNRRNYIPHNLVEGPGSSAIHNLINFLRNEDLYVMENAFSNSYAWARSGILYPKVKAALTAWVLGTQWTP